jgi:hypothetical protein
MPNAEYWRQQAEMMRRIARAAHRRPRRHANRLPERLIQRKRHAAMNGDVTVVTQRSS